MKITVGICGGIAVYKVASLVSYLSKENDVKCIMTKHATQFVAPLTFKTLSKRNVITDMFESNEEGFVEHIEYAQKCDALIVAPATADIIGKVANGIADDMLSSTIIACDKPVIFVPAMNTKMYTNKIVQDNIKKLKEYGYYFIEPDVGHLACDADGIGKYPDNKKIINFIEKLKGELS